MGNFNNENLIPFTGELKPGQRLLKRPDGYFLPVGMSGGSNAVAGYFADLDGNGLKFYPVGSNNGESVNQIMIADTGENEPQYESGNSMDFYKCVSVDTVNSNWTGYKAVLSEGIYTYESSVTSGLTYVAGFTPKVGKVYNDGALIQSILYQGLIPLDDILCYALPDTSWVSGQSVSMWGDFIQPDTSLQPQIATIGGVTGIKARNGDVLSYTTTAPTGDFTFLAKFYVGSTADDKLTLIAFNSMYGAIIGFENGSFFLSKQGVDSISCPVNKNTLGIGTHNVAVTYSQSTGETKFYFDGVLTDTETYYNADFEYSGLFRYAQEGTSDNLILGLAAYNRVLSAVEIAEIRW